MDCRVRIDEKQPLALRGARAGIARGGDLPMIYAHNARVILSGDLRCRIGRRIIHNNDFVLPANCLSRAMDCLQCAAKLRLLVMRRNDERNHVAGLDHSAKITSQPFNLTHTRLRRAARKETGGRYSSRPRRSLLPDCKDCEGDGGARTADPLQFRKRNSSSPCGEGMKHVDGANHDGPPGKKISRVAER